MLSTTNIRRDPAVLRVDEKEAESAKHAIFWFAILAIIMIASINAIKRVTKNYKDEEYILDDDVVSVFVLILLYVTVVVTFIGTAVNIGDSIGIALNPDYKAIELLLDLAKSGNQCP